MVVEAAIAHSKLVGIQAAPAHGGHVLAALCTCKLPQRQQGALPRPATPAVGHRSNKANREHQLITTQAPLEWAFTRTHACHKITVWGQARAHVAHMSQPVVLACCAAWLSAALGRLALHTGTNPAARCRHLPTHPDFLKTLQCCV
jgi:hypothetical protein